MLVGKHYQNGYTCDDIEEGIALFKANGLEKDPHILDVEWEVQSCFGLKKQNLRICMFWLNGLQYELIQPIVDETGVYANAPSNGGPLRFHHICMRVPDWTEFRAKVDAQDFPVVMERDLGPDQLRFAYLDGRKVFGHYLEYTNMSDAMWEQFRNM